MDEVRAIAVGPDHKIYVAGDKAVHIFQADGSRQAVIEVAGTPSCVAVGGIDHAQPGRIYIAVGRRIELFAADGKPVGTWDDFETNAILTSIALAKNDIFVADAA
ncbi:MAG: hypothetical protein IIC08_05130, partial [Proteobacteria bacterium]|nr:hypothetical protein [Pseudomonadota bacterium]